MTVSDLVACFFKLPFSQFQNEIAYDDDSLIISSSYNYFGFIWNYFRSEIGKSWNEVTYDELGKSNEISIIASLLNIQTAFEMINCFLVWLGTNSVCSIWN